MSKDHKTTRYLVHWNFPAPVKNKPPSHTSFLNMTYCIITAAMSERPPCYRINEVSTPLSFDRTCYKVTSLAVFELIVLFSVKSNICEAPHYEVSFILLFLLSARVQPPPAPHCPPRISQEITGD